jgi:hypothetical protein
LLAALSAALGTACGKTFLLDGPLSPRPESRPAGTARLRAGFGRADITPPGGVGLAGNGPEGRRARGYRLRLFARVMLLEDPAGNRLALVVADLPLGSALLHRRVAGLTAASDGIGLDRLFIAVTHTHSGPGHYFESGAYNDQGSSVVGYSAVLVDSLAHRIAAAVHAARLDLREARAAWGSRRIWGYARIRSMPALLRNLPPPAAPADAPDSLPLEYRLIDPTFTMLRIDQRDSLTGSYRPAGAFSIFAIHGTGNASENELLDADLHGLVERRLERHIDPSGAFVPKAFHLFANGAEGDVSPAWPSQSRCALPVLAPWTLLDGPFTRPLWQWQPIPRPDAAACIHAARRAVERIGNGLGDEAIKLFDSLGGALDDRSSLGAPSQPWRSARTRSPSESAGCRPSERPSWVARPTRLRGSSTGDCWDCFRWASSRERPMRVVAVATVPSASSSMLSSGVFRTAWLPEKLPPLPSSPCCGSATGLLERSRERQPRMRDGVCGRVCSKRSTGSAFRWTPR